MRRLLWSAALAAAGILMVVSPPGGPSAVPVAGGRGTRLPATPAPGFRLVDQFGAARSLEDFRGRVVVLAFIDARCTDTCPILAQALARLQEGFGAGGDQVQLLAVNANPDATAVADVRAWSDENGMAGRWLFLTGAPGELERVWRSYHVLAEVEPDGQVVHTSAVYLLDRQGREQYYFAAEADASADVALIQPFLSSLVNG